MVRSLDFTKHWFVRSCRSGAEAWNLAKIKTQCGAQGDRVKYAPCPGIRKDALPSG